MSGPECLPITCILMDYHPRHLLADSEFTILLVSAWAD